MDITFLIAAIGGGIFGAAVGALPAFILCGVAAIVGAAVNIAGNNYGFSAAVAWGPFLSPEIAFAGGVAAAAYAKKVGKLDSGKDILSALMGLDAPDVLVVGGIFGAVGYAIRWLIEQLPKLDGQPLTNSIAFSVFVTAIAARLMFGNTGVFGTKPAGYNRWMPSDKGGWLPYQSSPMQLILMGLGFGLPIAWFTKQFPGLVELGWGWGVLTFIFLQYGTKVPVFHTVALPAALVTVMTGDIWWGMTFGLVGAILMEVGAVIFYYWGDTHIDPPAVSLWSSFTVTTLLAATGILKTGSVVAIIAAVVLSAVWYFVHTALRGGQAAAARPAKA